MTLDESSIDAHYSDGRLIDRILDGLQQTGKDVNSLHIDDLAAVDEFHTRGRESTRELAAMAPPSPADCVLDVGCGIGGSARFLASSYHCHVTGIDLTAEYIDVARRLSSMVGLQDRVDFLQGNALELPFKDARFDTVWTEHAQMNIENKGCFYGEIARVLKPGGRLMLHDVFAGTGDPVFPLPWADQASISFLVTEQQLQNLLDSAGLQIREWVNTGNESMEAFQKALTALEDRGLPPLGIHLMMGDNALRKTGNYLASLKRGSISVAMGVATKDLK